MTAVLSALVKALGQLGDRRIVAVVIKSVALTLAVFALAGAGLYVGLAGLIESYGYDGEWAGLAAVVVVPVAMWLLFRVVALAVLQFFADEVVAAVEARHYPMRAAQAQALPFRRDLANSLRGLVRALGYNLLALPLAALVAFTGFGPAAVFLGVNALLLGRELTDMAWMRHTAGEAGAAGGNPAGQAERFLLGLGVAGLMLVPVAGLLGPVVGAAAGTHLVLRRMDKEFEA
jgi:uncharacterized protein involved in cysteine biosynthesis